MSAQADVGNFTSVQLSDSLFDWIPMGTRACMLKFKVKNRSLFVLQEYAPNESEYQAFLDDVNDTLQRIGSTEFTLLLGDFIAHQTISQLAVG